MFNLELVDAGIGVRLHRNLTFPTLRFSGLPLEGSQILAYISDMNVFYNISIACLYMALWATSSPRLSKPSSTHRK